jgi:hypothetical protein
MNQGGGRLFTPVFTLALVNPKTHAPFWVRLFEVFQRQLITATHSIISAFYSEVQK